MGIEIATSHRILIASDPGWGKTTFAMRLLTQIDPDTLVVVNPGAEQRYYDTLGDGRPQVNTAFPAIQHVVPVMHQDKRKYDSLWWPIVQHGNVYTLVDETSAVSTESQFGPGLTYLVQMGRRRNCGQIWLTQKLTRIPTFLVDMMDHVFVGYVAGRALERLEKDTGKPWRSKIESLKPHQWIYWSKYLGTDPVVLPLEKD